MCCGAHHPAANHPEQQPLGVAGRAGPVKQRLRRWLAVMAVTGDPTTDVVLWTMVAVLAIAAGVATALCALAVEGVFFP